VKNIFLHLHGTGSHYEHPKRFDYGEKTEPTVTGDDNADRFRASALDIAEVIRVDGRWRRSCRSFAGMTMRHRMGEIAMFNNLNFGVCTRLCGGFHIDSCLRFRFDWAQA